MFRKLTTLRAALLIAVGGVALGTASPAAAVVSDGPYFVCHYDGSGNYTGATAKATGVHFTPAQITEYGCHN
jgi:hypothetical protein